MKSVFSKKPRPDPELLDLKAELLEAQGELALAYRQFNQAVDPELVESCIYQISAVKARCNYLIRTIKERSPEALAAFNRTSIPSQRGVCGRPETDTGAENPGAQGDGERHGVCEDEEGGTVWT